MNRTARPDIVPILGAAFQGLFGAVVAWFFTCALAGVIPVLVTMGFSGGVHRGDLDWFLLLAWVWHLVLAAISIWGFTVVIVHGLCLSALVHGTHHPLKLLSVVFMAQLTTSTISHMIMEEGTLWPAAIVCLLLNAFIGGIWGGQAHRRKRRGLGGAV